MRRLWNWFDASIRNRLVVAFAGMALIPLVVMGLYSVRTTSQALAQDVKNAAAASTDSLAHRIENSVGRFSADALAFSKMPPIQGIVRARGNKASIEGQAVFYDPVGMSTYDEWVKRLDEIFVAFAEADAAYVQIRYLDETGQELVRVDRRAGHVTVITGPDLQDKSDRDYFINAMKLAEGEIYISPLNLNREQGQIETPYKPVVRYATPVLGSDGVRRGIVVTNIDASQVLAPVQERSEMEVPGQFNFLVNSDGYYLSHPQERKLWGFDLGTDETAQRDFPVLADALVRSEHGVIEHEDLFMSVARVQYDLADQSGYWVLVTVIPRNVALSPVVRVQRVVLALALVTLLTAAALGVLITNYLTHPLIQVTETMARLETGDLTITIAEAGIDEIGRLRGALARTVGAWRKTIGDLRDDAHRLSATAAQLASSSEELSRTATSQADQIGRASSAVEEMAASIQEVARNANATAEAAAASRQRAQTGARVTANTVAGLDRANAVLVRLRARSDEIGTIVSLIQDIAAQTNILALNAAIEAAGAGQAGTRFDVVAEEIRKLASRTAQATGEIGELIGAVQAEALAGAEAVSESSTLAQDAGLSLTDIVETSASVDDMMQIISSSTAQQSQASEDIAASIETVVASSRQTAAATQETAQVGVELSNLAERLKGAAAQFKL